MQEGGADLWTQAFFRVFYAIDGAEQNAHCQRLCNKTTYKNNINNDLQK
jgi:hypothetical protein